MKKPTLALASLTTLLVLALAPSGCKDAGVEGQAEFDGPDATPRYRNSQVLTTPSGTRYLAHQVVVRKNPELSDDQFQEQVLALGGVWVGRERLISRRLGYATVRFQDVDSDAAIASLRQSGAAQSAERDYVVKLSVLPNDPEMSALWGLEKISAPAAWSLGTGDSTLRIGVLDTGIDLEHEDLRGNLFENPNEIADNGIDDDQNGYIDDIHGYDVYDADPIAEDRHGHGSHVAGTIAASGNNGLGVTGVLWRAALIPIRVCSSSGCPTSAIVEGLLYAESLGARVVNLSLGGVHPPLYYEQAAIEHLRQSGVLVVAAAGNDSLDVDRTPVYPAAYPHENIISVAATNKDDALASFSNYGVVGVDLSAPGTSIRSTYTGGRYAILQGTSMAAPHVTGAVGLYWAQHPEVAAPDLKTRLLATVDHKASLEQRVVTSGRLNVGRLVGASGSCTSADDCGCSSSAIGTTCSGAVSCEDAPCGAHALCTEGVQGVSCSCPVGFVGNGLSCNDLDECANGTDQCSDNAGCVNTVGSYECHCYDGFSGDGRTCLDVDECEEGFYDCSDSTRCENTIGSYTCVCDEGTSGDESGCDDIDECTSGLSSCDVHASCENRLGSYGCRCSPGYAGDGFFCSEVAECAPELDDCHALAECTELDWGYACLCQAGYVGDGKTCEDADECELGTHSCDPNARCENTEGGYSCRCLSGYEGDGITCTDIDECEQGTHDCSSPSVCENTAGEYRCVCPPGYEGDGTTCQDIDECSAGTAACDRNAVCEDRNGGYACICQAGYSGDGFLCVDVDECTLGLDNCSDLALCTNREGGFSCACQDGYQGDGLTCSDIDECTEGTHDCDRNATCGNTTGAYQCSCRSGFMGDGFTCEDLDECALQLDRCDENARCLNTEGNYQCECNAGYEGGGFLCEDIDECGNGWAHCGEGADCKNTPGSYQCVCKPGYRGDGGGKCEDIDECAEGTHDCSEYASCVNGAGSFSCTCNPGYEGDGRTCRDVDECANATDDCARDARCDNTAGSYACTCNTGYEGDGITCTELDECALGTHDCDPNANCQNTSGGFNCTCRAGYQGDGTRCTDLDECALGSHDCDENARCYNTDGSYQCECLEPYTGNGKDCFGPGDVDECATGTHDCGANTICRNTDGSYRCECPAGYEGDGRSCWNLDECTSGAHDCDENAVCEDTDGSFTCTCVAPWLGDGRTCRTAEDANECAQGTHDCDRHATCIDTDLGFECVCNAGYQGDGRSCEDVDECGTELHECDPHAQCTNLPGGYSCACTPPYFGDGVDCQRNECELGLDQCAENAECIDTEASYTCGCWPGFAGNGVTCDDVDECEQGTHECSEHASCLNTHGGYDCFCDAGFVGDGWVCLPPPTAALSVSSSGDHSCALYDTGSVRCWGRNHFGQLGYGNTENIGDDETVEAVGFVPVGDVVVEVSAGVAHSCVLLAGGSVLCWGKNSFGQLGIGHRRTVGDDELPLASEFVDLGAPAISISAGGEHTCALLQDGAVRCWGLGIDGQLGYADTASIGDDEAPAEAGDVPLDEPARQIAAGRDHTCALLDSGKVQCWGRGAWGAIGHGTTENIGDDEFPANAGTVPLGAQAVRIAAGWYHSCAVLEGGAVTCWGYGAVGQLGFGNDETIGDDEPAGGQVVELSAPAVDVATGLYHSCALLENGQLSCFGYGDSGRLGYANTENIGDNETPASAGTVEMGAPVTSIALGYSHSCAVLSTGAVLCFGGAKYGQLGGGNTRNIGDDETPAGGGVRLLSQVNECSSGYHDCGLGSVCVDEAEGYSCHCDVGFVENGERCEDRDECAEGTAACHEMATCTNTEGSYQCECVAGFTGDGKHCTDIDECAAEMACDANATCHNLGGSYSCTCNPGYLGNGFVCTRSTTGVQDLALGHVHSCALLSTGAIRCWGDNSYGQLGYGNTRSIGDNEAPASAGNIQLGAAAHQVVAGGAHTCALLEGGKVRCFGRGNFGQLGSGNTSSIGDNELPSSVPYLTIGGAVRQLAAGAEHTCALLDTGAVRCWGAGGFGRLGYGNTENIGDDELPINAGNVDVGGVVTALSAGRFHTCAILENQSVRCWGHGFYGQLGYGNTRSIGDNETPASEGTVDVGGPVKHLVAGQYHTCALLMQGGVRCWGYGAFGALGYGSTASVGTAAPPASYPELLLGAPALELSAGDDHTCVILEDGDVRCWGLGKNGQLGTGNMLTVGDNEHPVSVAPIAFPAAAYRIASGRRHSCALLPHGVYCWGDGSLGQLGYGTTATWGDDELPALAGSVPLIAQ